ncbi:hypothetical protein [Levilactobacillus parabrevis]|uniref:hypothetical protein n=1 Tax=Levilactobacillus parabrevis TaxID=357278 RepID=UPI0021A27C7F|nr:hypothetical protein [Levilactobacillus parabrevis]MCT4488359.1 hypothetical protein [Levilactobacillus parabrevis]MCT4491537.1 hypothetical protein [Levilactobacillus parabrevis]
MSNKTVENYIASEGHSGIHPLLESKGILPNLYSKIPVKPAKNLSAAFQLQFINKSLKIEGKRSGAESRGRKLF